MKKIAPARRAPKAVSLPIPSAQTAGTGAGKGSSYPFRVFVSYSHDDKREASRLIDALTKLELRPYWDEDIDPGMPFTDAIKGLIRHAHLFVPLITRNAQKRPWVHQETGFAMALNIPVLPVAVKGALPVEMTAQLQALTVAPHLTDITEKLKRVDLERTVTSAPRNPDGLVCVAEQPEERTRMMVANARRVLSLRDHGQIRQSAVFGTFCIPDADVEEPIWELREGRSQRSPYARKLMREERQLFEQHARAKGCSLILVPSLSQIEHGPTAVPARLYVLLKFLESMPDDKVRVVASPKARHGNLTILGDWFIAESLIPRPGGFVQTVFNWHAPTVLVHMRLFDQQLSGLERESEVDPSDSRQAAIAHIRTALEKHPAYPEFAARMSGSEARQSPALTER